MNLSVWLSTLLVLLQFSLAYRLFKGVIVADDSNFEDIIHTKGKYTFMNFYSTGCEHCQKLGPKYETLATLFNNTDVQIAHIEGRQNKRIRKKEGIAGFPTLRLYAFDGTHVASYNKVRTAEAMAEFIAAHTGVMPRWPDSKVEELENSEKAELAIENSKKEDKNLVLAFVTPWLENWNDRMNAFEKMAFKRPELNFFKIDATKGNNAEIVSKFRISQYPTLVYINTYDKSKDAKYIIYHDTEESSEKKVTMFLNGELGEKFNSLQEIDTKAASAEEEHILQKKRGFNYGLGSGGSVKDLTEEEELEKYRQLREL